ncbi:MAG: tetratricopeptide repeat protein, partial [Lacipirellulaceae bacterium]
MSQSPTEAASISPEHPYAQGAAQLNRLVREGRSFSGTEPNCDYLNTRGVLFANVSTVSGLDFPDDGRAIAAGDWDFDGDVDFWVANRTGPQLRWMRNDLPTEHHFVALRLIGKQSNRDGIGATVRLYLPGNKVPLTKSLRAGEGYLAQGSKWLHFGLGDQQKVETLEIQWPSGAVDRVEGLNADGFYKLVEGQEKAIAWEPPRFDVVDAPKSREGLPSESSSTQVLLSLSAPLPPLRYDSPNGESLDASQTQDRPRLVNLWATWCQPCLVELKEWSKYESEFEAAGLDILALSVDAIAQDQSKSQAAPARVLERLGFPYESGTATTELLDILQLVNNAIFRDDHRRLPVPTSLLIDGEGNLAAVYKGGVDVDRLLADVRMLSISSNERERATLPFAGRWMGLPGPYRMAQLVDQMWEKEFEDEAVQLASRMPISRSDDQRATDEKLKVLRLLSRRFQAKGQTEAASKLLRSALEIRQTDGQSALQLGTLAAEQGEIQQAIRYFEIAVEQIDPPQVAAHLNLAMAYRKVKQPEKAEEQYRQSLLIDSKSASAHSGLGLLLAEQAKFSEAAQSFAKAVEAEPANTQHRMNLATAYLQLRQPEAALEAFDELLEIQPESLQAQSYAAEALASLGKLEEAVARLEKIVALEPKATQVWYRMGQLAMQGGKMADAVEFLERTHELAPKDPTIAGNLAWILATAPDDSVRNGKRAVELASMAVEATGRQSAQLLDALATAHAEAAEFEAAQRLANEALQRVGKDPAQRGLADAIRERLERFKRGEPFRLE